jgi:hypothetical protein
MKRMGFSAELAELVSSDAKTKTWRLFDDKDLQAGDRVEFVNSSTQEVFARAELVSVQTKTFRELSPDDWDGHENYQSDKEMYQTYSGYYDRAVGPDTELKVIDFRLIK